MRTIALLKFKKECVTLLENLGPEGIVITNRGKPVACLMPVASECVELIGSMKGKIRVHGDILCTQMNWNAAS